MQALQKKNGRIGESDKEDEENEIIQINTTSAKENKKSIRKKKHG